jgi:Dynamin central region/Dynamin family
MGIPAPECPQAEGQSSFSDDIFRIELCSPGIFRTTEKGKTTDEDKLLVKNMVRRYIENPRTIILPVVAANVDIATTEILDMAAEVDPTGQRTLGILTKPDLVDKGAEQDTIDLARGRKKKLKLGYCVVRNRGKQERNLTSAERNRLESSFFQAEPWSSLDRSRTGISALSPRLRDLLSRITRHEFPTVVREITNRIVVCEEELRDLGPTRQTPEQQRRYLLRRCGVFTVSPSAP